MTLVEVLMRGAHTPKVRIFYRFTTYLVHGEKVQHVNDSIIEKKELSLSESLADGLTAISASSVCLANN